MTGNDGTIISFSMVMDESMEEGAYPVVISTARYAMPDGQMIEVPVVKTTLTIENDLIGDVNNNGCIDIGDAICLRLPRSAEGRLQGKNSTAASILQAVCVPTPSMLRISSKRALPNVLRL